MKIQFINQKPLVHLAVYYTILRALLFNPDYYPNFNYLRQQSKSKYTSLDRYFTVPGTGNVVVIWCHTPLHHVILEYFVYSQFRFKRTCQERNLTCTALKIAFQNRHEAKIQLLLALQVSARMSRSKFDSYRRIQHEKSRSKTPIKQKSNF